MCLFSCLGYILSVHHSNNYSTGTIGYVGANGVETASFIYQGDVVLQENFVYMLDCILTIVGQKLTKPTTSKIFKKQKISEVPSSKGNFALKLIRAKEVALDVADLEEEAQAPLIHFTGTMTQLLTKKTLTIDDEILEYRYARLKCDGYANGSRQIFELELRVEANFSNFDNILNKSTLESILTVAGELILEEDNYFILPAFITFASLKTPTITTSISKPVSKSSSLFSKKKQQVSTSTKSALLSLCTPEPSSSTSSSSPGSLSMEQPSDYQELLPEPKKRRIVNKGKEKVV